MVQAGQPAWTYYFSYVPPSRRGTAPGASHGDELGYVFGNLGPTATPDAVALSKAMHAHWLSFAKTGRPGPDWVPVTATAAPFMEFSNDGARLVPEFGKPKLDFITAVADRG
jgi:para-nitrobenzyl esterase